MKIIKANTLTVSTWAGGTTTQLAIGPEGSDYTARRFGWRLSTATVSIEESPFTPLPKVQRHLMVLTGELLLEMPEGSISLKPFEQHTFDGGLSIVGKSSELVTDFNLMTQEGYDGRLEAIELQKQATLANIGDIMGLYVVSGNLTQPKLEAGDLLLTEDSALHIEGTAQLVITYIQEV